MSLPPLSGRLWHAPSKGCFSVHRMRPTNISRPTIALHVLGRRCSRPVHLSRCLHDIRRYALPLAASSSPASRSPISPATSGARPSSSRATTSVAPIWWYVSSPPCPAPGRTWRRSRPAPTPASSSRPWCASTSSPPSTWPSSPAGSETRRPSGSTCIVPSSSACSASSRRSPSRRGQHC